MCNDHVVTPDTDPIDPLPGQANEGFDRRTFLRRGKLLALALATPASFFSSSRAWAASPQIPKSHATHVHSSGSEQFGSVAGQAAQASATNTDVLWLTDHDRREEQLRYRSTVHFTDPINETGDGAPWKWIQGRTGGLTSGSVAAFVSTVASPSDPAAPKSVQLIAQSTGGTASLGFDSDSHPAGWNERGNLYGQTHTIDMMVKQYGQQGWLEYRIASSWHPATGGRSAGQYNLVYRLGGPGAPGTRVTDGRTGIIYLELPPNLGTFVTHSLTPTDDIAALWPDMDATDFGYGLVSLYAVSTGDRVEGYFDYLRFGRQFNGGNLPLERQQATIRRIAGLYPQLQIVQGMEVSGYDTIHANWLGPNVSLPDYSGTTLKTYPDLVRSVIAQAHQAGAVVSLNHPFGAEGGSKAAGTPAQQDQVVAQVAASLLANGLYGADLMEVGYKLRGGCDLRHHLNLWDILSQNNRFITGIGASDDHVGMNWRTFGMNWFTSTWSDDASMPSLTAAFRNGRSWCASLPRFRGTLDMLVDRTVPMGSVSVATVPTRQLQVMATGLPAGSSLRVLQGSVNGATGASSVRLVASYTAAQLVSGSVVRAVDTSTACFIRLELTDSSGNVIAVSNPVWLLRQAPAGGIPAGRAA